MNFTEITLAQFRSMISIDAPCDKVEQLEHGCKFYYKFSGITFLQIDSYNAFCTQYYIQYLD